MNLFVTSACPERCARDLDDARVVNQLRETCQLLSTAVRCVSVEGLTFLGQDISWMYASAHVHHPVTAWVASCAPAFQWTVDHAVALANEYHLRFPGSHRSAELAWRFMAGREYLADLLPDREGLPDFQDSACNLQLGLDFRGHADGVHEGYRDYLRARWRTAKQPPRWYRGTMPTPEWA